MSGPVAQRQDAGETEWFARPVRNIARPWRNKLARRLAAVDDLDRAEGATVLEAGHTALLRSLHAKLVRLFLIELHALRRTARGGPVPEDVAAGTDTRTWSEFIEQAGEDGYLDRLVGRYPTVAARVASVAGLSVAATTGCTTAGRGSCVAPPTAGGARGRVALRHVRGG